MQVISNGDAYYRINEVCKIAGISRSTLLRWIGNDTIKDASYRDRRGWRLFTDDEVKQIKAEASKINRSSFFTS
jgi:excisionase family DNA binding protein